MKKIIKSLLVMAMGLLMSVNVMADVQTGKTEPDYATDYYMIVESKAGGIDIYSQPDFDSSKLNEEQIPNGTALHIEGEVEDTENNRTWGYTEYHGMYGYAPLDECRPAESRKEAIDSELYIAGRDHVNYNADYDVKAESDEGSQKLYQGPGKKYGEVPGVRDIENGETLHITEDAEMVDGSHWGVTTVDGTEGWVDLEQTEEWRKEHPTEEETDAGIDAQAVGNNENEAVDAQTVEVSVTPEPTVSPTPAPTATDTPMPPMIVEDVTETPVPTVTGEAEAMPTEEATETPAPTEIETPAPTETEAPEATETEAPVATEAAEETDSRQASGQNVKAEASKWYQSPFAWIAGIAILVVIGLLIYHNKKKNK